MFILISVGLSYLLFLSCIFGIGDIKIDSYDFKKPKVSCMELFRTSRFVIGGWSVVQLCDAPSDPNGTE